MVNFIIGALTMLVGVVVGWAIHDGQKEEKNG